MVDFSLASRNGVAQFLLARFGRAPDFRVEQRSSKTRVRAVNFFGDKTI